MLWELTGPYWTLPIEVGRLEMGMVRVRIPEVPLLKIQRAAIDGVLEPLATGRDGPDYFVQFKDLHRLGRQSDSTDPESIVAWHPLVRLTGEAESDKDFVGALMESGVFQDPLVARHTWTAVRQVMLHWLLVRGRVLDLMFATIAAVPWRDNWMSALTYALLTNPKGRKPDPAWVKEHMTRPELLAASMRYSKEGPERRWIIPGLCITPNGVFYRNALRVEKRRFEVTGENYWHSVFNRMKDLAEFGYGAFCKYLAQMRRPFPYTHQGDRRGREVLPPSWREAGGDLRSGPECVRVPASVVGDSWADQERFIQSRAASEARVPEVPDI